MTEITNKKTYLPKIKLAEKLGITRPTLDAVIIRGNIKPNNAHRYALEDLITQLKTEQSDKTSDDKQLQQRQLLQSRLILRRCELVEHELAVAKGKYISVDVVRSEVQRMVNASKMVFMSLPTALAPELAGLTPAAIEKLLRERLTDALNHLSTGTWSGGSGEAEGASLTNKGLTTG